jgi:cell division initiation protein
MKITPIEIRQKEFVKAFRGYEKEEVDAFLISLSKEWERIMEENRELGKKFELAEREIFRLREVEGTLYRTLKSAEDTGTNIIGHASKTAELHMKQSQMDAEALLNEARSKARSKIEEAEEKAKEIIDKLNDEIHSIEKNYYFLQNQKEMLLREIKNILDSTNEKISRIPTGDNRSMEAKLNEFRKHLQHQSDREVQDERMDGDMRKKEEKNANNNNASFFDSIQ